MKYFLQIIPVFAYKWLARKYGLRMTIKGIEFAVIDDTLVRMKP